MRDFKFQDQLKVDTREAWGENKNVLLHLATGGGKTKVFADLLQEEPGHCVALAHRQELVGQMSLTLARNGVRHKILASNDTIKSVVAQHVEEYGANFYDPNARITCASVDTVAARGGALHDWAGRQRLWVVDEGHHCLADNKWGRTVAELSNARGLLPTACPLRADGKGLGRQADGLADAMVAGPSMRWLIDNHYLSDYSLVCPPAAIDAGRLVLGNTGDYTSASLIAESRRAIDKIVGDAVDHYLTHTPGLRGMMFTTDIQTAQDIAAGFRARGVNALAVSGKSPTSERVKAVKGLRSGAVQMVVNVDLFGEGTDVPLLEVVILGRKSDSRNLFLQQVGRVLRWAEGKPVGHIIDMVGNVLGRHGLPDDPWAYSLDRANKQARSASRSGGEALTSCAAPSCARVYERYRSTCPYCGHTPEPAGRGGPEQVAGDLIRLDAAALAALRARVDGANVSPEEAFYAMQKRGAPKVACYTAEHRQRELLQLREQLRVSLADWAARGVARGRSYSDLHRLFYLTHGVDVLSAQALDTARTSAIMARLANDI